MTVAGQSAVSYAYDDANRLTTITQGTSEVSFTYDDRTGAHR
jgi:RHS Repeat